jgi:hypothetical protein
MRTLGSQAHRLPVLEKLKRIDGCRNSGATGKSRRKTVELSLRNYMRTRVG